MLGHLVFYKGTSPVVAIPLDGGLKIALIGVNCFPSYTFKRKIFKVFMAVRILIFFIFPISFKRQCHVPVECFQDQEFLREMHSVFIWSLVSGRGRAYVHFLSQSGIKKYFSKLTINSSDFGLLHNERDSLQFFSNAKNFSVPSVSCFVNTDRYCFLVTESIPADFKLCHPETSEFPTDIASEIQTTYNKIPVFELVNSLSCFDKSTFNSLITNLDKTELVDVSRIHGDFGSENIFKNKKDEYIVIDWERSEKVAPILTDEVGYWLGKHHKIIKNDIKEASKRFRRYAENKKEIDVLLALVFLCLAKFDLAEKILKVRNS